MLCTCSATLHFIHPAEEGESAVAAAVAVLAGWLAQVTPDWVQELASCLTSIVRPPLGDVLYSRSSASAIWHPAGTVGRLKRTRARVFSPLFEVTLRIESPPKFLVLSFWLIQLSALALAVTVPGAAQGALIVQEWL